MKNVLFNPSQLLGYSLPVINFIVVAVIIFLVYRKKNNSSGKLNLSGVICSFVFALSCCVVFSVNAYLCKELYELKYSLLYCDITISKLYLMMNVLFVFYLFQNGFIEHSKILFTVSMVISLVLISIFDVINFIGMAKYAIKFFNYVAVVFAFSSYIAVAGISIVKKSGDVPVYSKKQIIEMVLSIVTVITINYLYCFYFFINGNIWILHAIIVVLLLFQSAVFIRVLIREYSLISEVEENVNPYKINAELCEDKSDYESTTGIQNRLCSLFESEKLYLSPNLQIGDVAERLYTNKSYLSKVLNIYMEKNFREFVNHYRIKEAMRLFSNNNSLSLNDLCRMCGFRNIASFTNAFKIFSGKTPGDWCRTIKHGGEDVEKVNYTM